MPGPSGYADLTRPEPLDPNDRQRQRTQSRSKGDKDGQGTGHQAYPYDQPVSYGKEVGTDMGGAAYQVDAGDRPPPGFVQKKGLGADQPLSVWDRLSDISDELDHEDPDLKSVEIGPQGQNAFSFGYGRNGLRDGLTGGAMDPFELEMDALRRDFRDSYRHTRPEVARMGRPDLLTLLVDLDPEYASERLVPSEDEELQQIYDEWAAEFGR